MWRRRRWRATSVAGCAGGKPVEGRPLRIATTVAPITSIVANIAGGSGAVVTGIVPEGVNSHTYEPAPSVAADARGRRRGVPQRPRAGGADEGAGTGEHARRRRAVRAGDDGAARGPSTSTTSRSRSRAAIPTRICGPNPPMAAEYATLVHDVLVRVDPDQRRRVRRQPGCVRPHTGRRLRSRVARRDGDDPARPAPAAHVPRRLRLLRARVRVDGGGRDPAVVVRRADAARRGPADRPDRGAARAGRVRERGVPVAGARTDRGRDRARATSTISATTICRAIPATPSTRGSA